MTTVLASNGPVVSRLAAVAMTVVLGITVAGVVALGTARSGRDLGLFLVGLGLAGIGLASARLSIVVAVATFMFWALLRRLVPAANAAVDPAALVPFIVALPLGLRGLRVKKPTAVVVLLGWLTISALLSFAQPLVGIAGWLNFALPLLAAYGVRGVPAGPRILVRSTVLCGSIAATYGIIQYFVPFQWDVDWLERTDFLSVGAFGKSTFRPFATLPAPGTAAVLSALVILVLVFSRDSFALSLPVRAWALVASTLFLLLAQVRVAWIAFVLALLVGLLASRRQSAVRIAICAGVAAVALAVSPQGDTIAKRAETLGNLQSDLSFQSRIRFVKGAGDVLAPLGTGLGSRSAGSRVGGDQTIDNGYLVVLAETGVVGLALLFWVLGSAARRARRVDLPFFLFLAVTNLAGFALAGIVGCLLWSLCGATRAEVPATKKPLPSAGRRQLANDAVR